MKIEIERKGNKRCGPCCMQFGQQMYRYVTPSILILKRMIGVCSAAIYEANPFSSTTAWLYARWAANTCYAIIYIRISSPRTKCILTDAGILSIIQLNQLKNDTHFVSGSAILTAALLQSISGSLPPWTVWGSS
jgi:hypothetical protein